MAAVETQPSLVGWQHVLPALCHSTHNKSNQFIVQESAPSPCLQLSPSLVVAKEEKICGKNILMSSVDYSPEFSVP